MTYYIASDHAGIKIKDFIKNLFEQKGHTVKDLGPKDDSRVDYPDFAKKVCLEILKNKQSKGILICGTGIGMSMSANKFTGIRAALCESVYSAQMAIEHNNANVLCLGQRVLGKGKIKSIVDIWNSSKFQNGRHEQRVEKINNL